MIDEIIRFYETEKHRFQCKLRNETIIHKRKLAHDVMLYFNVKLVQDKILNDIILDCFFDELVSTDVKIDETSD